MSSKLFAIIRKVYTTISVSAETLCLQIQYSMSVLKNISETEPK